MTLRPTFNIPWNKKATFQLPFIIIILLFFAAIIINIFFWTQIKPKLENEAIKLNLSLRENLIQTLSRETKAIESLTKSLAVNTETIFGNEETLLTLIPNIFNTPGFKSYLLGGGIWPEPFTWDASSERASYFWGRLLSKELKLYRDYNTSLRGYFYEEWYIPNQYLSKGQTYWSRSYTDPFSLESMITVSTPIFNDTQFLGAVSIDISLKYLHRVINESFDDSLGYAYVLDRSNRFISFPKHSWIKTRRTQNHLGQTLEDLLTANELGSHHPIFFPHLELINKAIADQDNHKYLEKNEHHWLSQQLIANSDALSVNEGSTIARLIHDYNRLSEQPSIASYNGFIDYDFIFNSPAFLTISSMPTTQWQVVVVFPVDTMFKSALNIITTSSTWINVIILIICLIILFCIKNLFSEKLYALINFFLKEKNSSNITSLPEFYYDEYRLICEAYNNKILQLDRLSETARYSERSKLLFLGTISHEFRTPINSILGFSQFLIKRLPQQIEPKYFDALTSISTNAKNLIKLINNVNEVSELEAGNIVFNPKKIHITNWLKGIIYDVGLRLGSKNTQIVFSDANIENKYYQLDDFLLSKAIEQILENSLESTKDGKVFVSWKLTSVNHLNYIKIIIRDTGYGISREKLNKLFQKFTNLNEKIGSDFSAGLGLYLAKLCTEMHQGEIHISSIESSGTTVSLTLPADTSSSMK